MRRFVKRITFALPELLPLLPSPDLINLRAACARVAHMSGVAEQIRHIYLFIGGDVSVTLTKIVFYIYIILLISSSIVRLIILLCDYMSFLFIS